MARVLNSVLLLTVIFAIGCDGDSKSAVKPGSPGPNAEDLLNSVATTTSDEKHGDEAVPRIASIGLLIGQGKTEEAKTQLKQVIEASVKENGSVNALQKLHALETMAQIAESEGRFEAALEYWALAIEHVDHSKIEGNKSPHFFHEFCQQQLKFDKSKREALIIAHQSLLQGQFNRSIEDLRQAADHYKRTLSSSHLLTKIATIQCERVLPSAEWLANNEFETARKEHEQFLGARAIYTLDAKLLRLDPIALEEIGDWFEGPNEVFESYLCIDQTRLFSSSLHESLHWMLKRKVDKTKAAQTKSEQLLPYVSRFPELQINYFNQVARFRFYSKAHQDLVDEMLKKSESVWKNNPELEKQQPNEVLVMLQGLAKSAMKQKRFTEAIQYADEVIRVAKANVPIRLQSMRIAEGLLMKGQIYSSTGKYELMEVNLRSALKRFSEFRKNMTMQLLLLTKALICCLWPNDLNPWH